MVNEKNKCVYCGCDDVLLLTVDHKTPLSRGGEDVKSNQQHVCWFHNQLKGALTHTEFLIYLKACKNLHKLCKLKLSFPGDFNNWLSFKAHFFPNFDYNVKKAHKEMYKNE